MKIEDFKSLSRYFPVQLDHCNYDQLMKIVEIIEDLDLSEYHYKWEVEGEEYNNFEGIEFEVGGNNALVWIHLSLDPDNLITSARGETKKEAIFKAIRLFIDYINQLK